jgi:hypothetical protein
MSELLKKMATQFGYEGREGALASELRELVANGAAKRPLTDQEFGGPATPAESVVTLAKERHVDPEVEPTPQVVNVFDPTGKAFPGVKATPHTKAKK